MPIIEAPYLKSKKVYALNPETFNINIRHFIDSNSVEQTSWSYTVDAVWYAKRSNGKRAAFFGTIHDSNSSVHTAWTTTNHRWDYEEFLLNYKSARYGGSPYGCYDGQSTWWGDEEYRNSLTKQNEILPFLENQLKHEPLIPPHYEGWYALTER